MNSPAMLPQDAREAAIAAAMEEERQRGLQAEAFREYLRQQDGKAMKAGLDEQMAVKEQLKRQAYEEFLKEKAMVDQVRGAHASSPGVDRSYWHSRRHPRRRVRAQDCPTVATPRRWSTRFWRKNKRRRRRAPPRRHRRAPTSPSSSRRRSASRRSVSRSSKERTRRFASMRSLSWRGRPRYNAASPLCASPLCASALAVAHLPPVGCPAGAPRKGEVAERARRGARGDDQGHGA
eukprot:scaffold140920_cov30-Tisochrysis_lutea.AAC.2